MRKFLLFALPLASMLMLAGCDQEPYVSSQPSGGTVRSSTTASTASSGSSMTYASSGSASQAAMAASAPEQPSYQSRNSTTQALPQGWNYLHEGDLTGGRLSSTAAQGSATTPAPAAVRSTGS